MKMPIGAVYTMALGTVGAAMYTYTAEQMRDYAASEVAEERERINLLLSAIRAHWIKANGHDSMSVSALDVIAEVIADGSYVERVERKIDQ
jgi:hypothetical protein